MDQKKLAARLKAILIGIAICGIAVYAYVLPVCGDTIRTAYPDFSDRYWPWLIFLWITAVPCYAVLVLGWKVAARIGVDRSFCMENAKALQKASNLAAGDTAFFFAGNIALLMMDMSHPGVVLASLLVCFAGVAAAVAAACLSHLVRKAADLQDESDMTV